VRPRYRYGAGAGAEGAHQEPPENRVGQRTETEVASPPEDARHAAWLGERLRKVRQQQRLSLHDVEELSGGDLKASVVGAYERGERTISITRLERLAGFYRVQVAELLPASERRDDVEMADEGGRVVIDLVALEARADEEPILRRYVDSIRSRRGDFNGRVLTVRSADLDTIAAVTDTPPDQLRSYLASTGVLR
jgi:transcriptional regulator with XRE-family HTH domain